MSGAIKCPRCGCPVVFATRADRLGAVIVLDADLAERGRLALVRRHNGWTCVRARWIPAAQRRRRHRHTRSA